MVTGSSADIGDAITRRLGADYRWTLFVCTVFGTFMIFLDSTIVNIALPKSTAVFGVPISPARRFEHHFAVWAGGLDVAASHLRLHVAPSSCTWCAR